MPQQAPFLHSARVNRVWSKPDEGISPELKDEGNSQSGFAEGSVSVTIPGQVDHGMQELPCRVSATFVADWVFPGVSSLGLTRTLTAARVASAPYVDLASRDSRALLTGGKVDRGMQELPRRTSIAHGCMCGGWRLT